MAMAVPGFALERLEPPQACYIGVGLDAGDSIDHLSSRLGLRPALYLDFFEFPLTADSRAALGRFFEQVRSTRGIADVTLEPHAGLSNVTETAVLEFTQICRDQEAQGIGGILVRFGHEMNGNWYEWGQQPGLYKDRFRLLAGHVHADTSRTAMRWAPSYGGGYPFGAPRAVVGSPDFVALDTDGDGTLTTHDDMYEPYYPRDDAVDWVGLTLYHWGVEFPWGENELPETNSFARQLTGNYLGGNGDQTAVPDFYARYCADGIHDKPLAIAETAALFNPEQGGVSELAIKEGWFRQLYNISGDAPDAFDVAQHFPKLKCVCWFDHYKFEQDQQQWIDFRFSAYEPIRAAFLQHVRTLRNGWPWFLTAQEFDAMYKSDSVTERNVPSLLTLSGVIDLSLFVKASTDCDLVVDLLDPHGGRRAGTRHPVMAGSNVIDLSLTLDPPLADSETYHWDIFLTPTGGDGALAFARYDGLPAIARAITPSIEMVAFPPALVAPSNFVVKVKYTTAESAVVVVNLLDAGYRWKGGGTCNVSRGDGLLEVPVALQGAIGTGNYILQSFLSDSSTNWSRPYARSPSFTVPATAQVAHDGINAIVEPATVCAGEVFRFTIAYTAVTNRDLHIDLFDANTNFVAGNLQSVPAGAGIHDLTIAYRNALPGDYFVTAFSTPSGQSWTQAVAYGPKQSLTVVVQAYQQWIESFWGVVLGSDPVDPQQDPDGDGANNAQEFFAGSNPRDAASVLKARIVRNGAGLAVSWPSAVGKSYQVFESSNLSGNGWNPVGGPVAGTGAVLEVAVGEETISRLFRVAALP